MRRSVCVAWLLLATAASATGQEICGTKSLCKEMATCAEARYHLDACGLARLDADNDGIPCETVCGQSDATMSARMRAQPFAPSAAGPAAQGLTSDAAPAPEEPPFTCGAKRTCRQMTSCAEATFHLDQCGVRSLDGNRDGIACNGLCK